MKYFFHLSFLFLLILQSALFSQEIIIKVNSAPRTAVLFSIEGETVWKIDSLNSNNGIFTFSLTGKHKGFYSLAFDKSRRLIFVNDGKEIEIESDFNHLRDGAKVIRSESNELFFDFLDLNKSYKTKTELLELILARYPRGDGYYSATMKKLKEIQKEYFTFVNETSQKNPNSFIARYIRSARLPVIDGTISREEQLRFLKSHSLDFVDFADAGLIESDLFTNKSIEYLTYFRNPNLPKGLLEKEFMKASDSLLLKAKTNEAVYQHIAEYLVKGFTEFGFEKVVNYIVDNYVIKDDLCIDTKTGGSIQKRIDQSKFLKRGDIAPVIMIADTGGNKIDLRAIKTDKVLVLFYASWCPHCQNIMPELVKLYNEQKEKQIEVLAISLDEKKDDWISFIRKNKMNWLNASDLKGWNGKAAEDYYIYATPSFFLLDKERKIISKPTAIEEIKPIFSD
ncbi:MAG: redoxin domain-containing protein [Chlorobi bacterium]|nr:redoxin domain-containing protein [Chlorobiota bacterium]